jgi:hypothetical protein
LVFVTREKSAAVAQIEFCVIDHDYQAP